MSTASDATVQHVTSGNIAQQPVIRTAPLYWSIRRELWENRSIYVAPLVGAAIAFLGFLVRITHLPARLRSAESQLRVQSLIEQPFQFAAFLIMGIGFLVTIFYCLDALYGERRDRSVLFWKSLPVSDLTTVLSKAIVGLAVIPIITLGITVATHALMLLPMSVVLAGTGITSVSLWSDVAQMWASLSYHMLTVHILWYAPFYAWLILASAWARRAPFLWATLPIFALAVVEKIAFNSSYVLRLLAHRFFGSPDGSFSTDMSMMHMSHLTPARFFSSPGLWLGLLVASAFLGLAVRLRRQQIPI